MSLWPIYVPTRGRARTSKLLAALGNRLDVEALAVVEPHEVEIYRAMHPTIPRLTLFDRDRGLVYARNSILEHAVTYGHSWFWMLDDDISAWYRVENGRNKRTDLYTALKHAQQLMTADLGQGALEYQQFAWSAKEPFKLNSYCDVAVAINADVVKAGLRYRAGAMKEDRDFTMQVIDKGWDVCRVTSVAFACPANGSNEGGLFDEYRAGKDTEAAHALAARWPWCCKVQTKRNGRVDAKIEWKKIRR